MRGRYHPHAGNRRGPQDEIGTSRLGQWRHTAVGDAHRVRWPHREARGMTEISTTLSDALVIFGTTGDLAYKQIFPALYGLVRDEGLATPIIGVARQGWSLDQLQ